ncbi:hypothetical protein ACHAWF_005560 [Thalassiosira exigua]
MALLRRLSSSRTEVMVQDGDADAVATTARDSSSVSSKPGTAANGSSARPTQPSIEESIAILGRKTESLLRTMRLDVVLLGSREEEMRSALVQLEGQWELLQDLRDQQKALEQEGEEAGASNNDKSNDSAEGNSRRKCASTIDWEDGDGGDSEEKSEKRNSEEKGGKSSQEKASVVIRNEEAEKTNSQLSHSHFDWGMGADSDIQQEARRASIESTGQSLQNILRGKENIVDGGQDENVPILRRIFQPRPQGETRGRRKDTDKHNLDNKQDRWPFFGAGKDRKRQGDDNSVRRQSDNSQNKAESNVAGESVVKERPAPVNFFGLRRKPDNSQNEAESITSACNVAGERNQRSRKDDNMTERQNGFQRMFRRSNRDSDASSTTRDTAATQALSVDTRDSPLGSQSNSEAITSLQVKLRGCDSAATSLHQLLSYQTRNLLDLEHERNRLKWSHDYESKQSEMELENLRNQLKAARVERRRKSRLLEDVYITRQKSQDQEGRLKGELQSIRTELYMLSTKIKKGESGNSRADAGEGRENRRSRHGKVLIVGGSESETSGQMQRAPSSHAAK